MFSLSPAAGRTWVNVLLLCYVLSASLLIAWIDGPLLPVNELDFLFGQEIDRLQKSERLVFSHRLPFVPHFINALSWFGNAQWMVLLFKNLIFFSLLTVLTLQLFKPKAVSLWLIVMVVYVATFPQLVRHGFALIPEEAYLIPMLAFCVTGLLHIQALTKFIHFVPFMLVTVLLALTKASTLLLAPTIALLFAFRSQDRTIALFFLGSVSIALVAFSSYNWSNTGRFTPTTMLAGYEIWKGNNSETLNHYPSKTLDGLTPVVPSRKQDESGWEWSDRLTSQAVEFNLTEPAIGLNILAARFYRLFVAVSGEKSGSEYEAAASSWRHILKRVGIPYMLVFRLMTVCLLLYALLQLIQRRNEERTEAAIIYLAIWGAFAAPYLLAFCYERHTLPMVIPTICYLQHVLMHRN